MRNRITIFFTTLLMAANTIACEDLIEVDKPKTQLIKSTVFEDDLTAVSAISGLYVLLTSSSSSFNSITYMGALSADELTVQGGNDQYQFFQNELSSTSPTVNAIWSSAYTQISYANSAIEGLAKSTHVTPALRNQLLGEARFLRAFHHFYLVNLYGDVPYITTTDYRVNGFVSRMPVADVYDKIIEDLLAAKAQLADDYSYSIGERVRVNKWVASALLARVYLFKGDWLHAEEQANAVIGKSSVYSLSTDLTKVFLKNSNETIWQLIPPVPQKFTGEGGMFIRLSYSAELPVLSDTLYKAFETGDQRKAQWVAEGSNNTLTWHYPFKYKESNSTGTGAEYATVFRLAEMFLVRAEARAWQNKLTGLNSAESDLNTIRVRAGLSPTTATTREQLLLAIEQERRVELFTEWGHRWLDLKRTSRADDVLPAIKPNWDDTDVLYPIPFNDLQLNPNLKPQNDGY